MIGELLARLELASPISGVCGASWLPRPGGPTLCSLNPARGEPLGEVQGASRDDYETVLSAAQRAFAAWRLVPAPRRGEVVRQFGNALRRHQHDLGLLVTLESGKILSEGLGEVQEMIDMCDYAAGLSRQLAGLTLPSERPEHRLLEQWHPLGVVGLITAFNFPVAVWGWNVALALVCGNCLVWKPSAATPLTAVAVQRLLHQVLVENDAAGVATLCCGTGHEVGALLAADTRVPLVSATGSCAMGKQLAPVVAARLGRTLLELGGNNAAIVAPSANLDLAERAILFAAVGTAGQRCTSLRRLLVHRSRAQELTARLVAAYRSIPAGDPWEPGVLLGPLIRESSVRAVQAAIAAAIQQGGRLLVGGHPLERPGYFITPALVAAEPSLPIVRQETFGPLLYLMEYDTLDEAIAWNNAVDQGLSSALFTESFAEAEQFLSASGSDCGLANVNTSTSGAEIGGAFGGEKETGGGREAGSDSWKAYMRRQTCTLNRGRQLPLAQGVRFETPN